MNKKVVFVHTVTSLVGLFNDLMKEILPEVEVYHVADEMLLKLVLKQGGLFPFIYQRVADHVVAAEHAGATVVQCTCSSISPCVEAARPLVSIPVLKIDEPMVDLAIQTGRKIGVIATAPTTLKPTTELVQERAKTHGVQVEVESRLCEGAYQALFNGDVQTHDQIVRQNLAGLMKRNQVILLAQASMARVVDTIPAEERSIPILASPRLAIEHLREVLTS